MQQKRESRGKCWGEMGEEEYENDGVPWVLEMRRGVLPSAAFYL